MIRIGSPLGLVCAIAVITTASTLPAGAGGFALREGSADWMANAFAGATAKAYDASTAVSNPAGMVRLNLNEFDASANYISPSARFTGANFVGATSTTPGSTGGNVVQSAATGAIFAVWSYAPDLKFGIGVTSPFGQRVANPGNFVGRYQSLVSSITDVQVALSAAYAITPELSIGGGPVIDYFHARLTQAINVGPLNALVGDPVADLRGDDTALGYTVGLLYQFDDATRIGLNYRSRIQHDIDGGERIFVPQALGLISPATARALLALSSSAKTQITLPDSITFGFYHQFANPRLAIMADVQWTHWSLFNNLTIVPTNGGPATVINERWRSTFFAAIGGSYQVTDDLLLQTGIGFDESPVRDQYRTSRIPDYSRFLIGVGATYNILENASVQVAYLHLFEDAAKISNAASATSGVLNGKYRDSDDSVSIGFKLRF